jgi:hypothetical protein
MTKPNPYQLMADRLNAMKPGTAWRIPHDEIEMLPGLPDWAFMASITTGFDRVKESVIGSSFPDVWRFYEEPNGDITAYRVKQQGLFDDRFFGPKRVPGKYPYRGAF